MMNDPDVKSTDLRRGIKIHSKTSRLTYSTIHFQELALKTTFNRLNEVEIAARFIL